MGVRTQPGQTALTRTPSRAQAAASFTQPLTTEIVPLKHFWPAEEYHRDYAKRNKADYDAYRQGCRRDQRLAQVWKPVG